MGIFSFLAAAARCRLKSGKSIRINRSGFRRCNACLAVRMPCRRLASLKTTSVMPTTARLAAPTRIRTPAAFRDSPPIPNRKRSASFWRRALASLAPCKSPEASPAMIMIFFSLVAPSLRSQLKLSTGFADLIHDIQRNVQRVPPHLAGHFRR